MKEYMESLGLDGEVVEAVMAKHGAVVEALEQKLRQHAVDSAVKQAVAAAGGRNLTAIRALLDETGFGDDPEADAKAAVAAVKRDNPYLFGQNLYAPGAGSPIPRAPTAREVEKMSLAEYRAYRKGI